MSRPRKYSCATSFSGSSRFLPRGRKREDPGNEVDRVSNPIKPGFQGVCKGFVKGLQRVWKGFAKYLSRVYFRVTLSLKKCLSRELECCLQEQTAFRRECINFTGLRTYTRKPSLQEITHQPSYLLIHSSFHTKNGHTRSQNETSSFINSF